MWLLGSGFSGGLGSVGLRLDSVIWKVIGNSATVLWFCGYTRRCSHLRAESQGKLIPCITEFIHQSSTKWCNSELNKELPATTLQQVISSRWISDPFSVFCVQILVQGKPEQHLQVWSIFSLSLPESSHCWILKHLWAHLEHTKDRWWKATLVFFAVSSW